MNDNYDEFFTPDRVDAQIEQQQAKYPADPDDIFAVHLIKALQYNYAPDRDYHQSLERVWNRFIEHRSALSVTQSHKPSLNEQPDIRTTRRFHMKPKHANSHNENIVPGRMAMIAAVVFVTLLVGSAVAVFQLARQQHNSTGQVGSCIVADSTTGNIDRADIYALTDNVVYKLDATTHKPLWHFQMLPFSGYGYTEVPGEVVNETYYMVGTDTDGYYFYALNTANGSMRWRFKLDHTPQLEITANPLIINNRVYISEASISNGYSVFTALNASTGKTQWQRRYNGTGVATGQKHSRDFATGLQIQAATNEMIYATSSTIKNNAATLTLFAVNANNGSPIWQIHTQTNEQVQGGQVANGALYITTGYTNTANHILGRLYAYDATTGSSKWSVQLDGQPYSPTVLDGVIYLGTTNDPLGLSGSVYALNALNGSRLWQYNTQGGVSAPIIENGIVYENISHGDGSKQALAAINAMKGTICWSRPAPARIALETQPEVSKNYIYLSIAGNKVDVLHLSNGSIVDTFMIGEKSVPLGSDHAQLTIVP